MEKELIELRIKLMNADRFIKVHNDPMAAQQVISNCMQQVNNLLEACGGEKQPDTECKYNKQSVSISLPTLKEVEDAKNNYSKERIARIDWMHGYLWLIEYVKNKLGNEC